MTRRRPTSAQHYDPRATHLSFFSPALGIEKSLYLYVPDEYSDEQRRFPVLYLLRGHEREWINPAEDGSRAGATVIDVYLRLRATGAIGPLILVMPSMASDDNHIPGMLLDMRAPERASDHSGLGTGRFERYFVEDLLPFVDQHMRTLGDHGRAITGFSLGGMMAVMVAARYPHLFKSVSAYDGTFFYTSDAGNHVRVSDGVLANPLFDAALDVPRDIDFLSQHNPVSLIMQADPTALQRIAWYIQFGPERLEPWGSNFYRGEHLLRALAWQGVRNGLPAPVIADGDHSWRTADRHVEQVLPLHWTHIG